MNKTRRSSWKLSLFLVLVLLLMSVVCTVSYADGYVVATESAPNATVEIKNPMILTPDDDYMCWPNGDDSINRPLQVIMNFKAQDTYEEACASKFGKWICDFYLTFEGVDGGVFSTEGCYLAGNYGSFGWIVIPADALATELECDIAYPIVSAYDANLTYENICDYVKDFTAAIYIAPALIEANPNFEVSLELRMTNPENSDDYMVVGAPAVYDAEALIGGIQKGEDIADLESNTQIGGEIVEENINVESAKDALVEAFPELAPEQVENAIIELEITVKDVVIAEDEAPSSYSYTVAPMFGIDDKQVKISELVEAITFRLPIHSKETKKAANVYHNGELMGVYEIKEENGEKFVEVSSASFSTFTVEPIEAPLPEYVAMIGETGYATLAEAIAAAQAGETIALIDNIILTETVTVPAGKDVTIDLCGYSISMEESIISTAYAIDNLGKLTLKDSNGNGSINARGIYNGYNNGNTVSTSVMIVNGVNINAKGTNGGACVFNYGTLTVNSGNFTSIGGYSLNNQATGVMTVNGGDANNGIYNCGNLVINDGNINGNRSGCHVIYNWNATLTINGGSFYNYNSGNSTIMVAGTSQATINAGTFGIKDGRVPGNGNTWTSCLLDTSNSGKLTVNGGTFNGGVRVQAGTTMEITGGSFNDVTGSNFNIYGSVVISGGSFTDDTAKTFAGKYLAPDFELNEDGVVVESVKPVAKIGDMGFASVADALAYAKNAGLTNVEITLVGETTKDSAVALGDAFDLLYTQQFASVTIKQKDASKPYYIACIYTGSRTNGGVFTFDGVNIVVTDQYMFEGNVKLSGNSVIKSVAEANCFIYSGITTVEPGSKLYGVIDDLRAGDLIIDGGRTDGQYNAEPDMQDAILVISWAGDSVTVQNGAYVKVNAVNEIGRASVLAGTSLNVYGSKFEAYQYIENNGTINLDATALITTGKLYGTGSIVIDVTGFTGRTTVIASKDLSGFTGTITLTGNADAKYEITENGLEIYYVAVAQIGDVKYGSLAAAAEAAVAGDMITLLEDIVLSADVTLPAGITLNGNGKSISGATVWAAGDLTFVGYTKISTFNAGYNQPTITISAGACLEITSGRMVVGHGATFNIIGNITDAKTANKADLTPSLIAPGASFTGAGVTFNVTNAYVKFTAYCSSKNSSANGTFTFNVTNSIWEQSGSLVFSEPTNGNDPTVNFYLTNSVLTSTSHLVFAVSKGEIVFDNSNVNVGAARQLENRSTLTIKNGSVVYAILATSSNAKNPGKTIVDGATYIATGEFSGADLGIGTLIVQNGATVTVGNVSKANVTVDVTSVLTVNNFFSDTTVTIDATAFDGNKVLVIKSANLANYTAITLTGYNSAKLILDGEGVTVIKVAAKIGDVKYGSLAAAAEAAVAGDMITLLEDIVLSADVTLPAGITLNGNGKSISGATVWAAGDLTFVGYTKISTFNAGYNQPTITISAGACLEITTGRMVVGHGATFNIIGNITDAKTANKADLTPSLIAPGASFTGAGVTFNVTNAYVKFTAYCSSKNSSANGTFTFNVTNSIWEQNNTLVFSEPTNGNDPTVNFYLTDSVLTSTSHLVFAVSKGEIVFDNSNVNVGANRQLENRSTLTIKNGSVVYAILATSSNAKNPGKTIVDGATYITTGEFSGADLGIGTLIVQNGASVTMGNISKANVTVDVTSVLTVNNFLSDTAVTIDATEFDGVNTLVIKSANLANYTAISVLGNAAAAFACDGEGVSVIKMVAQIGDVKYETLADALAAAVAGDTIWILGDITEDITELLDVTFATNVAGGVTITNSYDVDWIKVVNFTLGSGVTLRMDNAYFTNAGVNVIEGTLIIDTTLYNANNAKLTIQNGGAIATGGMIVNRYHTDGTAGIYVYGDGDDSTVEISSADTIGTYSGTFYAKDAVVNGNMFWIDYKKGSTEEADKYSVSNVHFVDSTLNVTSEFRLYKDASLTLEGSSVTAGKVQIRENATPVVSATNSTVSASTVENLTGASINAVLNSDGTVSFKPILIPIEYTNVGLTDSFKISFAFPVASFADLNGYYVVITKTSANDGSKETLVIPADAWFKTAIEGVDHYVVDYAGVAAKEMMDVLSVVICDADGNVVSAPKTDSIQDYAMRKLSRSTDATLNTLLVDMLNYGAQAQIFFGYATDKLANADLTDEQKAFASDAREYSDAMYSKTYADGYDFTIANTLILENNIQLKAGFDLRSLDLSEDAKIVMTYVNVKGITVTTELSLKYYDYKNEVTLITCDGLTARDADVQITFELVDGENVIATFTNSVEGFVARLSETSEKADVCTALMKYCDSAKAYFAN